MVEEKRKLNPISSDTYNERFKRLKSQPNLSMLDTINIKLLDFDFDKVCCISSSSINVYCCLTCGKYLQGRLENTPAFIHSLNFNHRLFINFQTLKIYILPDNTLFHDEGTISVINEIRHLISPTFEEEEISTFPKRCLSLNKKEYLTGFVNLNSTSDTSYITTIVLAFAHITPIRDYFLLKKDDVGDILKSPNLENKLGLLIRKIWSPQLAKPHISPNELIDYLNIHQKSNNESTPSQQTVPLKNPTTFLLTLIHQLSKTSNNLKTILFENLQGKIDIKSSSTVTKNIIDQPVDDESKKKIKAKNKIVHTPFWLLKLELPSMPILKKGLKADDIPRVKLGTLLSKYNGTVSTHAAGNQLRSLKLKSLPNYLIIQYDRFKNNLHVNGIKNGFSVRNRNQTLIDYPMKMKLLNREYQLIMNIIHKSSSIPALNNVNDIDDTSSWLIQINDETTDEWWEINERSVSRKEKQLLFLGEVFLQIWRAK
ncbi:hypothetical protein TBLA_0C00530 [Henningerozyma blattae CBS 6284]|uniref:Uncharacterized protein n=1 Tax=Henningerozyma blattae (strain ATCC 34711 / CBS 6284 / DSM 70876 / NBRC 10599 / NRRL Y-10934 / UCD 77-7) TaxID=1071380 RepID=I2H0G7_HENB6|nr:hypothetical protein TBLA_0C00530 [Tetrapisispora blattae CBS 6284]CCH59869.1 hypothetical protein TBLA_0C00530 [Tetrapisispora blattae CBS 6284]